MQKCERAAAAVGCSDWLGESWRSSIMLGILGILWAVFRVRGESDRHVQIPFRTRLPAPLHKGFHGENVELFVPGTLHNSNPCDAALLIDMHAENAAAGQVTHTIRGRIIGRRA